MRVSSAAIFRGDKDEINAPVAIALAACHDTLRNARPARKVMPPLALIASRPRGRPTPCGQDDSDRAVTRDSASDCRNASTGNRHNPALDPRRDLEHAVHGRHESVGWNT